MSGIISIDDMDFSSPDNYYTCYRPATVSAKKYNKMVLDHNAMVEKYEEELQDLRGEALRWEIEQEELQNAQDKAFKWEIEHKMLNDELELQKKQYSKLISELKSQLSASNIKCDQLIQQQDDLKSKLCSEINDVKVKNDNCMQTNAKLMQICKQSERQNANLRKANGRISEEHKELEYKHNELKSKYNELKKKLGYEAWSAKDILDWIIDINNARFQKYYDILLKNMTDEGIDGGCLADLQRNELKDLGVSQFKDRRDIFEAIRKLVKKDQSKDDVAIMNNEEHEGVNDTPYIDK